MFVAKTPEPPYYAVIFTAVRTPDDEAGYIAMADEMRNLAAKEDGFIGMEAAGEREEITVSYWKSLESIRAWNMNLRHREAQTLGREKWYSSYHIRIAEVTRAYGG